MRIVRWTLAALAAIYALIGAAALVDPGWLLGGLAITIEAPAGALELRGSYGGVNLAIGVVLGWAAASDHNMRGALALLAVVNAGYAVGRIVGLVVDPGWYFMPISFLVFELAVLGFAFWGLGRLRAQASARL
jgi:hypothetical protein